MTKFNFSIKSLYLKGSLYFKSQSALIKNNG